MDEVGIEEIVNKVFEKAKKESVTHTKNGLCRHIEKEIDLSYKTLERAYEKYQEKDKSVGLPTAESVNFFCKYLGYDDYRDYVLKNKKKTRRRLIMSICVVLGVVSSIWFISDRSPINAVFELKGNVCMTWADSLYVTVSCDTGPFSTFGTEVKPLDQMKLKNMRKVEVNAAYPFFSEDGKPLVWYFKNTDDEIEYFTAPGLHPTTGETLRKITPYIIQTYVAKHSFKEESFLK